MTNISTHCDKKFSSHINLIQRLELNPRRGEIVKRSRTGTFRRGGRVTVRKRDDDDDITPRVAQEEPGHNVEPRAVKPAYNNLRSANPDGSIQLILRQNLSLVLNLAGLKAISLPPSLPRLSLPLRPVSFIRNLSISHQSIPSYGVVSPSLILLPIIQPRPILQSLRYL